VVGRSTAHHVCPWWKVLTIIAHECDCEWVWGSHGCDVLTAHMACVFPYRTIRIKLSNYESGPPIKLILVLNHCFVSSALLLCFLHSSFIHFLLFSINFFFYLFCFSLKDLQCFYKWYLYKKNYIFTRIYKKESLFNDIYNFQDNINYMFSILNFNTAFITHKPMCSFYVKSHTVFHL
jgi:hypothetical protein